jgi:hypothetical protein
MNAPAIARVLGLLFLVVGAAGFVPWISPAMPPDAPVIALDSLYRNTANVLPTNEALDIIYALLGIWGFLSGLRFTNAVRYCRSLMWIALVLVVLGSIPITNTIFGFAPIYGYDVALHAVALLLCAYGGYGRGSHPPQPAAAA